MRRNLAVRVLGLGIGLLCLTAAGWAQGVQGVITGQVIDPSGAAIPGAKIIATNIATNVSSATESAASGDFTLPAYPGTYRLEAEADGFKRYRRDQVTVAASTTVRVDVLLELGSVSETVEVSGSLLTVQTEDAKVSTSVENKLVDELPLVVSGTLRSPFNLITIAAQANQLSGSDMSIGGGQSGAWNATMDGLSIATNRTANQDEIAYTAPSVEAITEVTVDTNGFKAEYGQAGGGVLTFSSKSGTNDFHGTAYEFLRNEKLDARGFFAGTRAVLKQHDYGASGGGPIIKNRTFFYTAYEAFRNRDGANDIIQSVATPEMYNGDFSNWVNPAGDVLQIYDPSTTQASPSGGFLRDPFANNQIPQSRFSPLAMGVIPYAQDITPNRGGAAGSVDYVRNNWITTNGTLVRPQDKFSAKVDHLFNDAHRIAYFFNITKFRLKPGPGGPPGLPTPLWTGQVQKFDTQAHRMTYDWVVTPTMVNHMSFGWNKFYKVSQSSAYDANGDWGSKVGCFPNVIDCNRNFPMITFSEFSGWGGAALNGTGQPMLAIKDDLSIVKGKHTIKFGGSFQRQEANGFGEQCIAGCIDFSFKGTSIPGNTSFNSGSSFASFLLGEANSGGTETVRDVNQIYNYFGFYIQDDWRLSSKLTMNIGLRWDYTAPPYSGKDEYSDFTPDRPNPAVNGFPGALRFSGFGEGTENSRTLVGKWPWGFGPRIGLAYQLDSKTTMRAAFGRSFSRVTAVAGSGHFAGFIGNWRFNSLDDGITPAFRWDQGLPYYPLPRTLDPNAPLDPSFANNQNVHHWQQPDATRAPENYYWTFNLQREVFRNTVFEAAYTANIGANLQAGLVNMNQVPTPIWNDLVSRYGATQAASLLRGSITSAAAQNAGINAPYANFFDPSVQQVRSVNQALRPYPQYLGIQTGGQGGDKSGHSSYHAMVLRATRRFSDGLAFEWNYTFSKLITDADDYNEGDGTTQDQYNRRNEKSIGEFDLTHVVKMSTVYELPFGKGKRFAGNAGKAVNAVIGGWRVGFIQTYQSGFPYRLQRNNPLPIFNRDTRPTITSYDGWRAPLAGGSFDPSVDRFIDKSIFPAQPTDFGNATRLNPKVRLFPRFNENVSLAKTFGLTEKFRLDLRWEAFNLLNRTVFSEGNHNINSNSFGVVTSQVNQARSMQVGLKLYW
ncbi:MAG: carboxypeptidase regulatory-like domain-containing protein [Acidobacteria bacterium]|nr:carboxypeptidase regulatory-like domain-containing protein [Acidobacteriota bacterium]